MAYNIWKSCFNSNKELAVKQMVMTNLWFFSRDERTHRLFRKCWHLAAQQCGIEVRVVCRGFGLIKILTAIASFIGSFRFRRVIFGTSEVCFYALFSRRQDIWVFTGLGRLLIDGGFTSQIIYGILKFLFRGQILVVLNEQDRDIIRRCIGGNPIVLEGEGYKFHPLAAPRAAQHKLTFAYVGRLLKSKGVDLLVENFARHSQPNWTLLLIGDSDFSNSDSFVGTEIDKLGHFSKGKIVLTGFRSDVSTILLNVDVLVSLSLREGLPFSVLDGVNAGVHLILSPVPGHLSFDGLPGVTFVEPIQLGSLFDQIADNPKPFLIFDRSRRLSLCKQKYGQETITLSIKSILMKSHKAFHGQSANPPKANP
jgi:glycosyltransferase involved in cell wall biosynthesis